MALKPKGDFDFSSSGWKQESIMFLLMGFILEPSLGRDTYDSTFIGPGWLLYFAF